MVEIKKETQAQGTNPEAEKNKQKDSTTIKNDLCKNFSANLRKLKSAMGWNQNEFASKWDNIATGALSNYIDGKRLPGVELMVYLCNMPDFHKRGLDFTVNDLLSEDFDPEGTLKFKGSLSNGTHAYIEHSDFIGNYLCYFNEQSDITDKYGNKNTRELRYGVLSVYDDINGVTARSVTKVAAVFFKASESSKAFALKKDLDSFHNASCVDNSKLSAKGERNKKIIELMSKKAGIYTGELTFSGQFAFVDIASKAYNDKALIVLYVPPKSTITNYVGGIGSIASVSHGREHMPTAQKIIISKHELAGSAESISPHLNMSYPNLTHIKDGQDIGKLCDKLYGGDYDCLNREDKIAIIQNRVNKIIKDYIKDNLCCASSVSEVEDAQIYKLITASVDE